MKSHDGRHRASLRSHLLALTGVVVVPLITLQVCGGYREYRLSEEKAQQTALGLAEATATSTRQFLSDSERVLAQLSTEFAESLRDPDRCAGPVDASSRVLTFLLNLLVVDASGALVCSARGLPSAAQTTWSERPWFIEVARDRKFTVGAPIHGSITKRWVVALAVPIFAPDGSFAGALAGSVDLARFQELLSGVHFAPEHLITIADRDARIVARSVDPEDWVGRLLPPETAPEGSLGAGRWITSGEDFSGVARTWGKVILPETEWRIYAGIPSGAALAPVYAQAMKIAALNLVVLLIAFGLVARLHRRISTALEQLVDGARRAALGESMPPLGHGPSEIAEVAHQVNQTLAARYRAEASERAATERYRSIVNNAVFGIYLSTTDGRFLEVNPALVAMLGYERPAELIAAGPASLYRDPALRTRLVEHYRRGGSIDQLEVEWLRKDGATITARLNGKAVEVEGDESVFEVIVEDITTSRALEEELRHTQKMEAIGRLAGGVAHDFNNLLTVIGGNVEMIRGESSHQGEGHEELWEISNAVERAESLTRQLLAFSRKDRSEPRTVDPNELVRGIEQMLCRLIGEDVVLRTRLSPGVPPVRIDPGQFEQAIMNLVTNARDAMPDGGVITIETAAALPPDGSDGDELWARVAVEDTGTGIAAEHRPHVFEPFFTTKKKNEGTGLGLSTVYGVITQAGGHVALCSDYTEGTRLELFLPGTGHGGEEVEDAPSREPTVHGSETILAVEDEMQVRSLVERILTGAGYRVLLASNGREALDVAQGHDGSIDLVVTDVVMPVMKGPEMAARLTEARPGTPVLFVSGYTDDHLDREDLMEDPESFLSKPFSPSELTGRIRYLLDRASASAAT